MEKMKDVIKNILKFILPIRNIIIMESNPDFTDNSKLVFDKLIENKVNDKYKIVWFVNNSKNFKSINIKNVKFIDAFQNKNIFKLLIKIYYQYSAKIIIDSNKYVPKVRNKQIRIYLSHGEPIKNADSYCKEIGELDYILETSDFFTQKDIQQFLKKQDNFVQLGFPRNDELFLNLNIKNLFPECEDKKIIVWLPTYRKHALNDEYKESSLKYGLPCIENEEDFIKINDELKRNNIIMLIKLHPAQDKSVIEECEVSNIKILTDEQLFSNNFNLYKLLAISDALITDYSSVYYDYLLTKKQIGLAISDIKEYEEKVGFAYSYYDTVKGEYMYNTDDMCKFINKLAVNQDDTKEERLRCLNIYHKYKDNKSSERVYEFIKKYL